MVPSHKSAIRAAVLLLGLLSVCDAFVTKGWGNMMDSDGGVEYEYGGEQTVAEHHANDFSEKQYESADPNDDENGYEGDYNTAETDKAMEEEEEKEESAAEEHDDDDNEDDGESFIQAKETRNNFLAKRATASAKVRAEKKKKGWGNLMDSDGGKDVEYGTQTVAAESDFSEKQYESADPNDDENGYEGDYNTAETNHPDSGEDDEGEQDNDDDNEDDDESLIQSKSKGHAGKEKSMVSRNKKGWGNLMDSDGGADVEYGTQTVAEESDFSEKQYESADPKDDENGYDGDYNTAETNHPDEGEGGEDDQSKDDDDEDDE